MKYFIYLVLLLCLFSCSNKSSNRTVAEKEAKHDTLEVVKERLKSEKQTIYIKADDSYDIDELRDALEEANDIIAQLKDENEELQDKIYNTQLLIDNARSIIKMAQLNIEDAKMMHNRSLLDDAEFDLMRAGSELDDAEIELW